MNEFQRRNYLTHMADYGDQHFDPVLGMLRLPMSGYRNVHTEYLDDTPRHPVRESLNYALVLLELAERSLQGRAEAIISRIIDLQETADPEAKTYGLWPYFMEEPIMRWPWPDFNWADFNGMILLIIWHRHRRRLNTTLLGKVVEAIQRAAICIRRRNVDLNYTNIAIKGTFVTLSAAEVTDDTELLEYAINRLERLRDAVVRAGTFVEYNSPTYAAISLAGLHAMATYVRDERAKSLVEPLIVLFWRDVGDRFHPETQELAGPHARAYKTTLHESPDLLGSLIEKASRGAVIYPKIEGREYFGALFACVINLDVPTDVFSALTAVASKPHQITVRSQARTTEAPRVQRTWLEPAFCLGSVSFQDGWEQRHNMIAYWKSKNGRIGALTHRYLRDDRSCCSGYFVSEQREGAVAAGAFLGAYADHHVSIPVDGTICSFLGPVIELDTAGESMDVRIDGQVIGVGESALVAIGSIVRVALSAVTFEWVQTKHDVSPAPSTEPRVEHVSVGRLRIVLPHYEGERRKLKWLDFELALSAYTLRMTATGDVLPSVDGLTVALPQKTPSSHMAAEAWGLQQEAMSV